MKPKIIGAAIVSLALLVCGALSVALPFRAIRQLRVRYEQTQRGITVDQVDALMAHAGGSRSEDWFPSWDEGRLPPAESQRIKSARRYSVSTFFLPVSFEFTFDNDRRLVGRHIYD